MYILVYKPYPPFKGALRGTLHNEGGHKNPVSRPAPLRGGLSVKGLWAAHGDRAAGRGQRCFFPLFSYRV